MNRPPGPVSVLIADDHPVIVSALQEVLKMSLGEHGVRSASATDGDDLLRHLEAEVLDCLVLDMHMPGTLKSVPLLRAVLAVQPELRVVVYTGAAQPCLAYAALELGARAYVSKTSGLEVVMQAIRAVIAGQRFVDPGIDIEAAANHPWHRLTPGERTVLVALARGEPLQAIAIDSGRSYKTVTAHKYNALRKLGLSANAELGPYLTLHGLGYELD